MEKAAQAGLAEYLKETEWASALVDWLHVETGISKGRLKLAVRLFAALVSKAAAAAGSGAGGLAARAWEWLFERIPGSARIAQALVKLDRAKAAEVEFEAVQAGKLLPRDAKLTEHLSATLRAQFVTQAWLHRIADRLNPQPFLDISCLDRETEAKRFVYTARSVRLLGREHEMEALSKFLEADAPFTWWVVAGPGGVGKSRLALEFAMALSGPWRMGFLRGLRDFPWQQWRPAAPTVLIADYANETVEELGDIARDLAARAAQGDLAHPVRLLLLVREAVGAWKSQFLGTGARRATVEEVRYTDPLAVSPLGDEALWEVLQSVVPAGVPLPDRDKTLAKLLAIDPQRRPLFALFAGDAIKNGRDFRQWDATALVNDVLEREKAHWKKAGATDKDINLLALATMAGSMRTTQLADLDPSVFPPANGSVSPDAFDPFRYQALVGEASVEQNLPPLLPDILGERFVLDHLQPRYPGDTQRADVLRIAAWNASPEGMFSFLSRAAMDFPESETLRLLERAPPLDAPAQRRAWGRAAVNLIVSYGESGQIEDSRRVYLELHALSEVHAADRAVREAQAKALFNLLIDCGDAGRVDDAHELYAELRTLSEVHPADGAVRETRAKAAVNLLMYYGHTGRVDEAHRLYVELRTLSERYAADEVVREARASAAVALLMNYVRAERVDDAHELYVELRTLSEVHPADGTVREAQVEAAFDLLVGYLTAERVDEAHELYVKLRTLPEAYAADLAVPDARAAAAFILLIDYLKLGRVDEAHNVYADLRTLSEVHPADAAVRETRAKAAVSLLMAFRSAGRLGEARQFHDELRDLAMAHSSEQQLAPLLAFAAQFMDERWSPDAGRGS